MSVAAGTRLGPYEVISRIGAGGMGEVWRAKDSRLDRSVAIKVLPAEFAENVQLRLRFEREAKTISQLNHPNICTLHDVGHDSGVDFLVLELIDGETVADRLSRGAMPLAEVLRVGTEIASALHRAHRAGIVHRDLKPGNVMLTKSGTKLLDFGLAKSEAAITTTDGATVQKQLTAEGTILGTFQYMAPEQLEGADADARTDIFAFGALLYEMATGRRAFEGKTKTSLIAAIVGGEPKPIRSLQPLAPSALQHVIAKCLEKEPDDRWQSAHDVAEELRWISVEGEQPAVPRGRLPSAALAALSLIALLATAVAIYFATAKRELPTIEAGITTDGSSGLDYNSGPPVLSQDGKLIAFSARGNDARRRIWLRRIEGGKPQPIAGTEGGFSPFWSPSGDRIAFFANGKLKTIPVSGGEADDLAQSDGIGGGSWSENGVILFAPKGIGGISRISSNGDDDPVAVTTAPDRKFRTHRWPSFLPDGKHFLYLAIPPEAQVKPSVFVASLDPSETSREVAVSDSNAVYAEGALLTVRNGVLRAQRFDLKEMKVTGEPVTIAPIQRFAWNGGALYTTSGNGLLAYQPQGSIELSRLVKKDRAGKVLFASEPAYYWSPRLSHDGSRIAVDKSDETTGAGDIWVISTDGRTATRLTFEAENETAPVWTADDSAVSYGLFETRLIGSAMIKKLTGGGSQRLLPEARAGEVVMDFSGDGSLVSLITRNSASAEGRNVFVHSLRDGKSTIVAATPADEGCPQLSPDARWVVYSSDETGRPEIYVQPFPPTGAKYQVSQGGEYPRWAKQDEIVYLSADEKLVAVAVETDGGQFRTTPPQVIFPVNLREGGSFAQYDAGRDGTFVLNELVPRDPAPMTLLVNWTERFALAKR